MKADHRILLFWIALILATLAPPRIIAQSASADQGPMEAFDEAEAVFAGYAAQRCTRLDGGKDRWEKPTSSELWGLDVVAIWKGNIGARVDIDSRCARRPFELGRLYLVYAAGTNGQLATQCRTADYSAAVVDRYLLPKPTKISAEFQFHEVSLDSVIYTVIEGSLYPEIVKDFKWLRKDADRIVPVFTAVLRSQSPGDTGVAVDALGHIGPSSRSAIPDLERIATGGTERLRDKAIRALDSIETNQAERLRRLIHALQDPSERIRLTVVGLISNVFAEDAVSAESNSLIAQLRVIGESEPDALVRERIELVLESVNDKR